MNSNNVHNKEHLPNDNKGDEGSQETVLLLFSGGMDSTYLLHYYLSQTDLSVHAHYISMRHPSIQRWKAEDIAVNNIIEYCQQHYRPFEFSSSSVEVGDWPYIGMDSNVQLTMACRLAPNLPGALVSVVRGRCADDIINEKQQSVDKTGQIQALWTALHDSISEQNRHRINPVTYCPLADSGVFKKDIIQDMPPALLSLCWSCRTPIMKGDVLTMCGSCHTCQQHHRLFTELGMEGEYPNVNPPFLGKKP